MAKYTVCIYFECFKRELPTSCGRYSTTLFEEAIAALPGGFNEWHIASQFPGGAHIANKRGEIAVAQLYRFGKPVKDFDEADKPQKTSKFMVFGGSRPIPCDSAEQLAKAIAQVIKDTGRHPAVQRRDMAC